MTYSGRVNENLDRLLRSSELPLWRVAADCGIHPSALSKYRSGDRALSKKHADALAQFFDVTPAMVTGEAEIPFEKLVRVREV